MNYASLLFLGVFFSFALSWAGMVLMPQIQLGRQQLVLTTDTKQLYPPARDGLASQGKEVYRSLGCAACHTQQVRDNDVPRWGVRFTVAQDYLREHPVLVGSQRIGPDLSNVGLRGLDANWHLMHLYDPQIVRNPSLPKSSMPPYHFLFEKRKTGVAKPTDALVLPPEYAMEKDVEIVPKKEALALVAYLQSLRVTNYLYEAPNPNPPKPVVNTNYPAEVFAKGKELYPMTCGACHQADGQGLAGQFPPLVGTDWVLAADPGRIIRMVLHGVTGPFDVNGTSFNNTMVPWKDVLPDDDIAALITYVRNEWSNAASAVKPEQVAAIREKEKDRIDPWTEEELKKIEPEISTSSAK